MSGPAGPPPLSLIAHRGNARDFPENTLPALSSAIALGLRFVEFDVQLAADHVPVVMHDSELLRTAGVSGSVFDRTAHELASTEVNEPARLGERYSGVFVPLLSEVMALIEQHPQVTAFVEIKRASLRRFTHEVVVPAVLRALQPARANCVVISFDLTAIHMARQAGFPIGWATGGYDPHTQLKCEALRPEFLFGDQETLPADGGKLWRGPWRWAMYEVDTPERARQLTGRGADLIETMAVASMAAAFPQEAG